MKGKSKGLESVGFTNAYMGNLSFSNLDAGTNSSSIHIW